MPRTFFTLSKITIVFLLFIFLDTFAVIWWKPAMYFYSFAYLFIYLWEGTGWPEYYIQLHLILCKVGCVEKRCTTTDMHTFHKREYLYVRSLLSVHQLSVRKLHALLHTRPQVRLRGMLA